MMGKVNLEIIFQDNRDKRVVCNPQPLWFCKTQKRHCTTMLPHCGAVFRYTIQVIILYMKHLNNPQSCLLFSRKLKKRCQSLSLIGELLLQKLVYIALTASPHIAHSFWVGCFAWYQSKTFGGFWETSLIDCPLLIPKFHLVLL